MRALVLVRTIVPQWTVAFAESFAKWPVGVQTEPVFSLEEVGESKVSQLIWTRGLYSRSTSWGWYPSIH